VTLADYVEVMVVKIFVPVVVVSAPAVVLSWLIMFHSQAAAELQRE